MHANSKGVKRDFTGREGEGALIICSHLHFVYGASHCWIGGGGYSLSELMSFSAPKKASGLARWGRGLEMKDNTTYKTYFLIG